jgi:hypothetical protein
LIRIKPGRGGGWSNLSMNDREKQTGQAKTWRDCIARRAGACDLRTASCLACGPAHQALRAAAWVHCRWPHLDSRLRD